MNSGIRFDTLAQKLAKALPDGQQRLEALRSQEEQAAKEREERRKREAEIEHLKWVIEQDVREHVTRGLYKLLVLWQEWREQQHRWLRRQRRMVRVNTKKRDRRIALLVEVQRKLKACTDPVIAEQFNQEIARLKHEVAQLSKNIEERASKLRTERSKAKAVRQ